MRRARCLAAALAAAVLTPGLAASETTKPAGNHPEWFGVYRLADHEPDLKGFKPEAEDIDAVILPRLQPWARLKMEQTNGVADDTGAICQPSGIFRVPLRGGGFMWLPNGENQILLVSTAVYSVGVRRVYLDRKHPVNLVPTWLGHSIGHWEGDTLVVDTVGFNTKTWLTSSMQPHSEHLHVVERFRMAAPELFEVKTLVEDRHALTAPYTFSRYFKLTEKAMRENVCGGDPYDQRMWTEWMRKAQKTGMLPVEAKQ